MLLYNIYKTQWLLFTRPPPPSSFPLGWPFLHQWPKQSQVGDPKGTSASVLGNLWWTVCRLFTKEPLTARGVVKLSLACWLFSQIIWVSWVCHPCLPGSQHTVAPCAETLAGEDGVCWQRLKKFLLTYLTMDPPSPQRDTLPDKTY